MRSATRCGRWRAVSTALLLALLGALVAAQPATGEDRDLNPWLRPATFETTGGTHWLAITEATPGDPVVTDACLLGENVSCPGAVQATGGRVRGVLDCKE